MTTKIYEGSLVTRTWGEVVDHNFYLDDEELTLVTITMLKGKFLHIDWYLNNRHYTRYNMNKVPKKYQELFNKLYAVLDLGEPELDFFSI